ncbi:MAG: hypothetical protein ABIO02_00025, partial [Patescibacteria group bacterium]
MNKFLGIVLIAAAFAISGFLSYNHFANSVSLKNSLKSYQTPNADSAGLVDASEPRTEECP